MKDFEDAMLDIAWSNLDSENNRFKDIDTKAIGIITITGILITFLSRDLINTDTITTQFNGISTSLFLLTILSFFLTIVFSILALRVRQYDTLSSLNLINRLKNESPGNQIQGIIRNIADTEYDLRDVCNSKAEDLKHAIFTLGLGISFLIFYTFSLFY